MAKDFLIFAAMWRNFARSGNTDWNRRFHNQPVANIIKSAFYQNSATMLQQSLLTKLTPGFHR